MNFHFPFKVFFLILKEACLRYFPNPVIKIVISGFVGGQDSSGNPPSELTFFSFLTQINLCKINFELKA